MSSFTGEPGPSTSPNFAGGYVGRYQGYAGVVAGTGNEACDNNAGILAGEGNVLGGDGSAEASEVTGGGYNRIEAAFYSAIGSGFGNIVGTAGAYDNASFSEIASGNYSSLGSPRSFIGGGEQNIIYGLQVESFGQSAFIGAGNYNLVTGNYSGVVAGMFNTDSPDYATIVGGFRNTISATGEYGMIGGGYLNTVGGQQAIVGGGYGNIAFGKDATIPGGADNTASGPNSFAAGTHASAATQGAFVWSDTAVTTALTSTVANEFLARATGGFYLYSSTKGVGVKLAPGSGSWSTMSDRNVKNNVQAVDPAKVLAKLDSIRVSEWSYNSEGSVRHLGPMAQDFKAAFNLGEDDKTISTVDEEGVALAAIKALKAENDDKDRQISELRNAHLEDQARLSHLESRLDAIEAKTR